MRFDPNVRDEHGRTAISFAAELGHVLCAIALIDHGASLEMPDPARDGKTPMILAAGHGHNDILKYLIDSGRVDINKPDEANITPLVQAINCGHMDTFHMLLANGAKARPSPHHNTALHAASKMDNVPVAQLLIESDPGCARDHESTVQIMKDRTQDPLWCAVRSGRQDFAELILSKGANINGKDAQDKTLLDWAATEGLHAAIDFLVTNGASVNGLNNQMLRPLHWALQSGHETTARLLIDRGASIHVMSEKGQHAIDLAARHCGETTVKFLLEKGSSVNPTSAYGQRLLVLAAQYGHERVVRLLLEKGADINEVCSSGDTALHVAVKNGRKAVARILLENGASVDRRTENIRRLFYRAEDEVEEAKLDLEDKFGNPSDARLRLRDMMDILAMLKSSDKKGGMQKQSLR